MNFKDRRFLENIIKKSSKNNLSKSTRYPLIDDAFSTEDILKGIEVLLSRKLTMSEITKKFENEFAKYV